MTRLALGLLLCFALAPGALAQSDRVAEILQLLDGQSAEVEEARRAALAATEGASPAVRQAALGEAVAPFNLSADDARLAAAIDRETDPDVRKAYLLSYVAVETDLGAKDAGLGLRALEEIGPGDPLWAHRPPLISRALALAAQADSAAAQAAAHALFEQHPDSTVQAYVLLHGLETAHAAGHEARAQVYFDLLQSDRFFETDPGLIAAGVFGRYATRVRVGAPVPEFAVPRLGGGGLVSRAALLGQVYLVDFWAEWCLPCIREMPVLHAAYERFGGRGFEILSVSMDDRPDVVDAFRAGRFPMPWLHVWNGDGFGGGLAQAFEVRAIPKPILVGPDGTILATSSQALRGANLEQTLADLLGE